jgi:hypothetical protein
VLTAIVALALLLLAVGSVAVGQAQVNRLNALLCYLLAVVFAALLWGVLL